MLYYRSGFKKLSFDLSLRNKIEDNLNQQRNNQQVAMDDQGYIIIPDTNVYNILVVDDQEHIVHILTQTLKSNNFNVISFTNIIEAFDYFELHNNEIDLIITDYSMPGMEGTDIIRKFKLINEKVLLVIFTGRSYITFQNKQERDMVDGVIHKPMSPNDVINNLRNILQEHKGLIK
jgi:DNA-binding response OmpR family regulator